jgi:hypothetical protein
VPAGWLAGLLVGVLESTPRLPPRVLLRRRWHRSPASPEKFGPTLTALVNDAAAGRTPGFRLPGWFSLRQERARRAATPSCCRCRSAHCREGCRPNSLGRRVRLGVFAAAVLVFGDVQPDLRGARMVVRPAGGDESGNGRRVGNGRCGDRRRGSARPRGLGSAAARSWQGGRVAAASSGCGGGPGVCRDDSAGDGIADAAGRA